MEGARHSDKPAGGAQAVAQSILAIVPFPMMIVTDHGVLRWSNRHAEILFGLEGSLAPGDSVQNLIPQLYHHIRGQPVTSDTARADGDGVSQSQIFVARHRDGYEIPVAALIGPVMIEDQRAFACSLQTVSDWLDTGGHTAPVDVGSANAIESNHIAALLVHELNQPMTAMTNLLAAAQLALMAESAPETVAGFIKDASAQSLRARDLLQRLRSIFSH